MKFALSVIAGIAGLVLAIFFLNAVAFSNLSFWGPKFEEANRKITQQSIRRVEGVSEGIGALCLNMRLEKDPTSKSALATMIVQQTIGTDTPLTTEATRCASEAEAILSTEG